MNWEESHLGEHFDIKHGYAFKGDYFSDSGKYIVVTPGNFYEEGGFKFIPEKAKYYSIEPPEDYILQEGDLIVAMTEQMEGLLGSPAFVPEGDRFLHNQRIGLIVNLNENTLDRRFLYFLFNTHSVRGQIRASATGTKVKHTAPRRILNVKVLLPDITKQREIGGILGAYDDLMANNERRIGLLAEAMHLLYREWFGRLRFPGWEETAVVDGVPDGWEKRPLEEVAYLNYGKSLPKELRVEGGISVYGSSGIVGTHNESLVEGPVIIVGRKGTIGSVYWSPSPCFPIDTVFYISPEQSTLFIYHNLQYQNFINTDAAVPGLNRSYAHSLPVLWPNSTTLEKFEQIAETAYRQVHTLQRQNEKLKEARDALLPRLMSGRIEV